MKIADIALLNEEFSRLTPEQRIKEAYSNFDRILVTSSFGTSSICLLHILSQLDVKKEVHFIDTTYHFPETLQYKEEIKELFNLNIIDLRPEEWKNSFTSLYQIWKTDPDLCCSVNKVEPLDAKKKDYEVWVSGLMQWQTPYRNSLDVFEEKKDILKFYPLIDVDKDFVDNYIIKHQLPVHPLVSGGYQSIGCTHCTSPGNHREGRWADFAKAECGLHSRK